MPPPALLVVAILWAPAAALAQDAPVPGVVLDGSLGPAGPVGPGEGSDYLIRGDFGRQVAANLFHSFERFSVGAGEIATFTADGLPAPEQVDHVVGRVTGGEISRIDGTIRSEVARADLWLLNPAGTVFGGGAELQVPAGFHVSTADALEFDNGERFEATSGGAVPMLAVAAPASFGFLGDDAIRFEGARLSVSGDLTVAGGEIALAPATRLEAGGLLTLETPFTGPFDGRLEAAGALEATAGADPASDDPEVIVLHGDRVVIGSREGASEDPGSLAIVQSVAIETEHPVAFRALGVVDVPGELFLVGPAVRLEVEGAFLDVAGRIWGGDEDDAPNGGIFLLGHGGVEVSGSLLSDAEEDSAGGPIEIRSPGGSIRVTGRVASDSGALLDGQLGVSIPGTVRALGEDGRGALVVTSAAGVVEIDGRLEAEGYRIGGTEDVGNIRVDGNEGVVVRGDVLALRSSEAEDSGALTFSSAVVVVLAGADVTAVGNALEIDAPRVEIEGARLLVSGLPVERLSLRSEAAGRVEISGGEIVLGPGTRILASSFSDAQPAGEIRIDADGGSLEISGSLVSTRAAGASPGGDVFLGGEDVTITDDSVIEASSVAGLTPEERVAFEEILRDLNVTPNFVVPDVATGAAGDITIVAGDTLLVENTRISTEAENASGGNIAVNGEGIEVRGGALVAQKGPYEPGFLVRLSKSEISTTAKGDGGNVLIDPEFLILEGSTISADAGEGSGGNILLVADVILSDPPLDQVLSASSQQGVDGLIEVQSVDLDLVGSLSTLTESTLDAASSLRPACAARRRGAQAGSFAVRGQVLRRGPEGPLSAWTTGGAVETSLAMAAVDCR